MTSILKKFRKKEIMLKQSVCLPSPVRRGCRTLGAGRRAERDDVTIPTRRRVVFVFPALGKSHREFFTWQSPICRLGHPRSLLKALADCIDTGAAISEGIPIHREI